MSSKAKKEPQAKPKKAAEKVAPEPVEAAPAPRPAAPKPTGGAPKAVVESRHEGEMIEREARGFSPGELGGAGFTLGTASRLGLATDIRRRTVLEKNVESLKSWFSPPKQPPAPKPAPAAAEEPKPKKRAPAKKTKK